MNKIATLLLLCTAIFAQQKGTLTDVRDGKVYKTVKIGEQVWMAENLNYAAEGSRCYKDRYYPNEADNCEKYGRLYNWQTAKTVCPKGWHLPNEREWKVLMETVGGDTIAGCYLKAASGWEGKFGNGEDKFDFSALPGGGGNLITKIAVRGDETLETFFDRDAGKSGYWWLSRNYSSFYMSSREYGSYLLKHADSISMNMDMGKDKTLYSVRCLQD